MDRRDLDNYGEQLPVSLGECLRSERMKILLTIKLLSLFCVFSCKNTRQRRGHPEASLNHDVGNLGPFTRF